MSKYLGPRVKTTLRVPPALLERLTKIAAERGTPLNTLLVAWLTEAARK